jgi:hypothetical protein
MEPAGMRMGGSGASEGIRTLDTNLCLKYQFFLVFDASWNTIDTCSVVT